MLASVITFLIYVCLLAIVIYLVIWVLRDIVGLPIPDKVIQLLWVIVALIAILWLVQWCWEAAGFDYPRSESEPLPPAEPFYPQVCRGC